MKRFTTKSLAIAAALAAVAVGASAQSMRAEIPFTFRVSNAVLEAGTYQVNLASGNDSVIHLKNIDTRKSILVTPQYRRDVDKSVAAGDPKLWFACSDANCVLTTLWNGVDKSAVVVGSPAGAGKKMAETRVVNLATMKAE